jgi:hypothetical protein
MNHDNRHLHNRRFLNGYVYLVALVLFVFSFNATASTVPAGYSYACNVYDVVKTQYVQHYTDAEAVATFNPANSSWSNLKLIDYSSGSGRIIISCYASSNSTSCPSTHPISNGDGTCTDGIADPVTCADSDIQKEFQNSQYACQLGNPNTQVYDTNFDYYCEDVTGQEYPNVSTSCTYTPNSCIVGLDCPTASDDPVCNPATDDCTLPEPNPDTVPDENPEIPVTDPEFCDLNPDVCDRPDVPAVEPDPIPNPEDSAKPDSPDLDAGFNALVKETSISNNHLTNVNSNIQELNRDVNSLLNKNNVLSQHQLGALKDIAKKIDQNGKNEASTDLHLSQMNAKLEDIKCLLDENCEADGKEKPTANVDCQASIFECKGDVIQCAMLKLQYENTCAADDLEKLEAAFAAHTGLDPAASIVQADEIDLSKIDSRYLDNGVSFGAAQCPAPLAIRHDFGFAGKLDTEFSFEPACEYARLINPLILVFAWLSGLYIIGRTQGVLS